MHFYSLSVICDLHKKKFGCIFKKQFIVVILYVILFDISSAINTEISLLAKKNKDTFHLNPLTSALLTL